MVVLDPDGTLLRASVGAVLAGVACAALSILAILLISTLLPPKLPARQVWRGWKVKRMPWSVSLTFGFLGAALAGEAIGRRFGMADLYWLNRVEDLLWIARLGSLSGFLLLLLLWIFPAALRARKAVSARS